MPNRIYYRIEVTVYLSDPKFHSTHAPYALNQRVLYTFGREE